MLVSSRTPHGNSSGTMGRKQQDKMTKYWQNITSELQALQCHSAWAKDKTCWGKGTLTRVG